MNQAHGFAFAALGVLLGALGCGGGAAVGEDAGNGDKAALEAAATGLKQPVALIAAYEPFLSESDGKDVYAPKRRSDLTKAATAAAGEIRFAANEARQKFKATAVTKELETALGGISNGCTDATETSGFEKCSAAVKALDAALAKAATAATAAGVTAKIPRVAPDSVTDEAKKAIAPFLKALKAGPAEQAYFAKRADAKATFEDVATACQAAASEATTVGSTFEKAEEPLRLVAVTHKLSLDSQCKALDAAEGLRKELAACQKKAKTTECKATCSKARTRIDEGLPAATFVTMETDIKVCEK